ncbi:EamA family transporter [Candidatus Woesearchaeota archaeon]|nr:EamA family transporter [Candidatus Woesearchaeota archaeon]
MEYSWIIFALLSAFTAALVAIFGKIGLHGVDTNTATAVRSVIMALFLISVIIIQGKLGQVSSIVSNHKALLFIVFSGIAGALSWMFYFLALKHGEVAKVAPIDRLSVVFAIVLALLFLGESVSLKEGIGAALIAAGAIVMVL